MAARVNFAMSSGWALAADSELQAPGSLVLAESSEGLGGRNAKACWSVGNPPGLGE